MINLSFLVIAILSTVLIAPGQAANHFQPIEEGTHYDVVCNGGDMVIGHDEVTDSYTLFLYEKEAIFYFIDRSQEAGPGASIDYNHALEVMVPYRMPDGVEYYAEIDGAILWVYGLKMKAGGRKFISYEYGPRLKQIGDGYELTISGVTQTPSNGQVYYKLGTRFFPNCSLNIK